MGAFTDKKLTNTDFEGKNIKSISGNTVVGKAEELKALFDSPAENVIKERFNQLLDLLESEYAAGSIGIPEISPESGKTVREQILYLKEQLAEAVAGQIPDGSIGDEKLSNENGQLKSRVEELENDYAPLESPVFTGKPTAPTPDGTDVEAIANAEYVAKAVEFAGVHVDNNDIHVTNNQKAQWAGHLNDKNNPHDVTAAQIGAALSSTTVNGKALSTNIELTAEDLEALEKTGETLWSGDVTSSTTLSLTSAYTEYTLIIVEWGMVGLSNAKKHDVFYVPSISGTMCVTGNDASATLTFSGTSVAVGVISGVRLYKVIGIK